MKPGAKYRIYMALRASGMPADQAHKLIKSFYVLRFGR